MKLFSDKQHFYKQILLWLFGYAIIALVSCVPATPSQALQVKSNTIKPISLIFAGDAMHHMPQYYAAYDYATHTPDYKPSFQYIKPMLLAADLAICNLETPIAGRPYSGYPQFSAPDEFLDALLDTGFGLFQLANNHILDRGKWGVERSINRLKEEKLYSIGAYLTEEHKNRSHPLYITIKGVKFAFLNYTYGLNGLRPLAPNVINMLDSVQINRDFDLIEQDLADLRIVLVHWGDEYVQHSNEEQRKWADYFIRKGADLIVGSHPHVVQEVDLIAHDNKLVPVFYSLGNLISNQQNPKTNGGVLAKIDVDPTRKLISRVYFEPFYLFKGEINKKHQFYLLPTRDYMENHEKYNIPKYDSTLLVQYHQNIVDRIRKIPINP